MIQIVSYSVGIKCKVISLGCSTFGIEEDIRTVSLVSLKLTFHRSLQYSGQKFWEVSAKVSQKTRREEETDAVYFSSFVDSF